MSTNCNRKTINYRPIITNWKAKYSSTFFTYIPLAVFRLKGSCLVTFLLTLFHRLQEQEARLERITAEQGSNVKELVSLTKDFKEIETRKASLVRGETIQAIMGVLIMSDTDYDAKFSEREIRRVKLKLDNLPAIKVNGEKLDSFLMGKDLTLDSVMKMVKELETLPEEERIFQFV